MPRQWSPVRIAVASVTAIAILAWLRPSLQARESAMFAGGEAKKEGTSPPARVYFKVPPSADAARVWIKLGQKVKMSFPQETPLEEVLKFVRSTTADKEHPEGLSVYVDPVGLQEAEKTMASPVTIDLENVKLETALKLVLNQLGLAFSVHPDGLIIITSSESDEMAGEDTSTMILDRLDALRAEVAELKAELRAHGRGAAPAK